MKINYQTKLRDNLIIKPAGEMATGSGYLFTCKPLSIDEIILLESNYNSGNEFPASLRELLFLAGQRCHVLDYSAFDTQIEIQDEVRDEFVDYQHYITRPFFVVDVHRGTSLFLFVYLDQGVDDPEVHYADLAMDIPGYPWLTHLGESLSFLVERRIEDLKKGISPH